MKKIFYLITVTIFSACGPQSDKKFTYPDEKGIESTISNDSAKVIVAEHFAYEMAWAAGGFGHGRHDISFDNAIRLNTSFLDSFLVEGRSFGYGGFIAKANLSGFDLPDRPNSSGLKFYICYDEKDLGNANDNELFIAFAKTNQFSYRIDDFSQEIAGETYYKSTNIIRYNGSTPPSENYTKNFLNGEMPHVELAHSTITYHDVDSFCNNFRAKFLCYDQQPISAERYCNDNPYGFIEGNELNELFRLSETPLNGVRFFFGNDKSENENKIRAIFYGSYGDRNLITLDSNNIARPYAKFLERSHP